MAELEEKADELGEKVLRSVTSTAPNWALQLGSRGVGNKIASKRIAIAQQRARDENLDLPDRDLAWLDEGTPEFDRYIAELR